jgi:signal transduction histidine kinase
VGDFKRLKMAVSNIIHNAIKYTDRGKVIIRAKDYDSENLLIQIQDNGRGIHQEQMPHLFDPYRRKSTEGQKYGGIGVGLAVSRMYVELQKGRIWVESNPGKGTTVNFTMPLYKDPDVLCRANVTSDVKSP